MLRPLLAGSALALLSSTSAFAHGDHGGGGGIVVPQGTVLVTTQYDVTHYNEISDARLTDLATQGVEEVHSLKTIAVPSVSLAYGLTNAFTIGMRIPYLDNYEIRETDTDGPGDNARGGVHGFGDISFTGTYRVLEEEKNGLDATITLGVRAPTGDTQELDANGERFETEHQPGSGSWDGIFGAGVSKAYGPVTLGATISYGLAGAGTEDTTLGDRFSAGVSATYRIWLASAGSEAMHLGGKFDGMMHHGGVNHDEHASHAGHHHDDETGPTLDLSLGLLDQWLGKNEAAGVIDDNTGGNVLYITPGLRLTVDKWSGFVNFGVPVSQSLNGIQPEPDWTLSAGSSYRF